MEIIYAYMHKLVDFVLTQIESRNMPQLLVFFSNYLKMLHIFNVKNQELVIGISKLYFDIWYLEVL